jgi:hypothetical protein
MIAGQLTNFRVVINAAPGGTNSWTFHIDRNDASQASCTITGSATSCTIAGPVSFSNGDRFAVAANRSGSAPQTRVAFKAEYTFSP